MVTYVAGSTIKIWVPLVDAAGDPITTAVDGDFSESIDHEATDGTLTAATVGTWTHRSNGRYYATISSVQAGAYSGTITYAGPPVQPFHWEADVLTAAQADPLAASTAGYAIGTLGNKVSTLGVSTAIVSEHVNIDGDRIELVRGDAYLNADGLAKAWSVSGVSVASATIAFDTFAGATAFSKAMVVSGGTVYVDLTSANTSGLTKGTPVYRYEVVATLSGGGTSTLFSGDVWVTD